MSYFGYKRGDKPRVNWGGLAEKFSQDLLAEKAARDQRKKSIADSQAKELAELDKQATTPSTSINTEIIKSSNDARQAYLTNVRLMRRGLIKPSAARAGQQRLADGYKMYNQYMTTWGEEYQKFVTDRADKATDFDDVIQNDQFKFGNVEQWGLVVDPNNMTLLMGNKDENGDVDMSKTVDMANIVNMNKDFNDAFDAITYYNNLGDKIVGVIETSELLKFSDYEMNQIYENYYEMGDPQAFIDAVDAAKESGDYSAVQGIDELASDGSGLTDLGMAYYNMFTTIDASLGAVNDRDRTDVLTEIGYNIVKDGEVDLQTLQTDAKYNKEGSKDIYYYRDEQNLLQPYLSESQNKAFEKDGLLRALAAKDFQIESQKVIKDASGGSGNNGPVSSFNSRNYILLAEMYRPGSTDVFNSAVSGIASNVKVDSGEIQIQDGNYVTGFKNNQQVSLPDLTGDPDFPDANDKFKSLSFGEKQSWLTALSAGSPGNLISPAQSSAPDKPGEWEILIRDFERELGGAIDLNNTNQGSTYKLATTAALDLTSYTNDYFEDEYSLNETGQMQNAKTARSGYGGVATTLTSTLKGAAQEVDKIASDGSLTPQEQQKARDLASQIRNLNIIDGSNGTSFNDDKYIVNVTGTIGGRTVAGQVTPTAHSMSEVYEALEMGVQDILNN
tara:strand:- start:1125 stop:3140 length:2016 start_codon:yes stop_codon:yes gene_type:complete